MGNVNVYTARVSKGSRITGIARPGGLREVKGANIRVRPVYKLSSRDQLARSPFEVRRRINAYIRLSQKADDTLSLYGLANALNIELETLKHIEDVEGVDNAIRTVVAIGRNRIYEWMEKSGYKLTNPTFTMFALEANANWSKKTEHKQLNVNVNLLDLLEKSGRKKDMGVAERRVVEGQSVTIEDASVSSASHSPTNK